MLIDVHVAQFCGGLAVLAAIPSSVVTRLSLVPALSLIRSSDPPRRDGYRSMRSQAPGWPEPGWPG
jgi:hypothetical protein